MRVSRESKSFLPVMRKEWIHIQRDRRLLVIIIFGPVLLLTLFGYALRFQPQNIPMSVFDEDRSYLSMVVKDKLIDESCFILNETDALAQIGDSLLKGKATVGLHIPKDFSAKIFDGKAGQLTLYVDGTMPAIAIASQLGASILSTEEFSKKFIFEDIEAAPTTYAPQPVTIHKKILFNPDLRDQNFFIPGIIGILIMQVTLVVTSMALVREREYRTFEQLIVTPVKGISLILGKIAPYAIISSVDFFIITVMGHLIFEVPVLGNKFLLLLLAVLYIIGFLSFGMFLSTLAQTQTQAVFYGVYVIIPSILLSGFVFPIEAMPRVLQPISALIPLTYFLTIARGVMLKDAGMGILFKDFLALLAFSIIFISVSTIRLKKTVD